MTLRHDDLVRVLAYEAGTGVLRWRPTVSRRDRAGRIAGSKGNNGYWRVRYRDVEYSAHRLIWFYVYGAWPSGLIDHIDGDPLNNRLSNLRVVNHQQNAINRRPAREGRTGVNRVPSGRYCARIMRNGVYRHLGTFDNPDDAHVAYLSALNAISPDFVRRRAQA